MHARLSRTRLLGFTLLELIVTIVVLGVLAALAVPAFSAVIDRSKDEVLTAELEALGRGIAALAAFDGGGVTDAHVEEFLAAETAATALVSTGRWDLYADADAPASPADGDLLFASEAGYVGLATAAAHRDGRVAYAVVGTGGTVAQLTSVVDADADTSVMRGADALCFYGLVGCTADADAEPLPSTGTASGGASGSTVAGPAFVAVGQSGTIMVSRDTATTWTTTSTGTSFWQDVTAGGDGTYVAVTGGSAAVSNDGVDWETVPTGTSTLYGVATDGNGTYIAVGYNATIARSEDHGRTWTSASVGSGTWMSVATDGLGTFVAINIGGDVVRSTDNGLTWSVRTGAVSTYDAVASDGDEFVAVGWGSAAERSLDGWSWSLRRAGVSGDSILYGVATDGAGTWLAVGSFGGVAVSSDDGMTWTATKYRIKADDGSSPTFNGVATDGQGAWVAVGDGGSVAVSVDAGATWQYRTEGTADLGGAAFG